MSARQTELVRLWRLAHPEYAKDWREAFKLWCNSERAAGRNPSGNSRPRTPKNKLDYEVHVSNSLTPEERFHVHAQSLLHEVANATGSDKDFKYSGE